MERGKLAADYNYTFIYTYIILCVRFHPFCSARHKVKIVVVLLLLLLYLYHKFMYGTVAPSPPAGFKISVYIMVPLPIRSNLTRCSRARYYNNTI